MNTRSLFDPAHQRFPAGVSLIEGALDQNGQKELLETIQKITAEAPPFQPRMPKTGAPFSVLMTNCGTLGWVSDKEKGYRYQPHHPGTGQAWPAMPGSLTALWKKFSNCLALPEACLINFYAAAAKMGSHRDADEKEPNAPVLSVSLGDDAIFHIGGPKRTDAKVKMTLKSGDVVVFGGASRFAYHGIDRVFKGTSSLVPGGGRINLTLRRVTPIDKIT